MLQIERGSLVFSFPDVHPEAKVSVTFMRTLRIPDDNKCYPLPPGLGSFPMRNVDDFKDRVPTLWREHGGVMLPMYQSEAMWLQFEGHHVSGHGIYPFAIKVATGKRSALTGDAWQNELRAKDYCIVPTQPWLDGYVVDSDTVRQFVAAPLGAGFTAEEQITKKTEFGGVQIEVFPMKRDAFERRFPKREFKTMGMLRGAMSFSAVDDNESFAMMSTCSLGAAPCLAAAVKPDLGLAPGGRLKQEVYVNPYDFSDWDTGHHSRCFVHLTNSLAWQAITKEAPPTAPRTSADYTSAGLPWFDYYDGDAKALAATETNKGLKSIMEMGFQKGFTILPENEPVAFRSDQIVKLSQPRKDGVREGTWG